MMFYIGALIPTYLISRLLIFILKKLTKKDNYIWANLLSAIICGSLVALSDMYGLDNYLIALIAGIIDYLIPQLVWLLRDYVMHNPDWRKRKIYKNVKNVLIVSYLKNKGFRRICFILGSISFLFVILNYQWNNFHFEDSLGIIFSFYWPFIIASILRWVWLGFFEKADENEKETLSIK